MDLRQLRYIIAIAEEGQITAAAKRLHMAQPPLSQQVKALEEELGTALFKRGHRHIELTEAGQLLYTRARQILDLSDATEREIADLQHGLRGTLKVGTVSSSGSIILSSAMQDFHKSHGEIHFEIHDGNTFTIIDMLQKGVIELGLVRTPFKHELFHCKMLAQEPMIAALTSDLDWCPDRDTISFSELAGRPLIIYRRFAQLLSDTCAVYNFTPTLFCQNDDARTTILWANAGLGIAITPASAFQRAAHDRLHYKIIDEPRLYTSIAVIWMKNRYLSSLAETFIKELKL